MSHELRLERLFDASPEEVFDAWVDPRAQDALFTTGGPPGWTLHESSIDLRVGGTWLTVVGPADGVPDRITAVFTEIERPHRLRYRSSMYVHGWGRTLETEVTLLFEDRDDETLVTVIQTGFDTEEDRDAFTHGWPGLLDSFGQVLKARHDTEEGNTDD